MGRGSGWGNGRSQRQKWSKQDKKKTGKEKQRKRRENDNNNKYVGDGGNDIQRLDSTVERYFLHGLAESTRKTYNSAKRRYSEFAKYPLPASEHQLCQFVSYQAEGKLCHSTIKCYSSAIRQSSGGIWGSPHEQHGSPGTSAEGNKVPPGQDQGKESPPPSHQPRSAAQNERGVAEKRYYLGQHDAIGSSARSRQYWPVRGPGPGPLALSVSRWQIPHTGKVGDGGEGSYLSSRSGQLTVLGAQLPERHSNYSCQAGDCRGR